MKDESSRQSETKKKPSRRRYLIVVLLFVVLVFVVCLYTVLSYEPKPDPASEALILKEAAWQLLKDPCDLTDEDLSQITKLRISSFESLMESTTFRWSRSELIRLSDINILEKFTNLEELELVLVYYPDERIPQWMKILARVGIIDLNERFSIDLKPLANLSNLEKLSLKGTSVSDIEPLMKLKKLNILYLQGCNSISEKQIEDLQKALPELEISR